MKNNKQRVKTDVPFHHLALQLDHEQCRDYDTRSVMILSPEKSINTAKASTELAISLSEVLSAPILLVDLSTDQLDLAKMLGCSKSQGLKEFLSGTIKNLDELIILTNHDQVMYLPSGSQSLNFSHGSKRKFDITNIKSLINKARETFEFIVFYGGSLSDETMALAVAPHVGRVLLTSTENETLNSELKNSHKSLLLSRVKSVAHILLKKTS